MRQVIQEYLRMAVSAHSSSHDMLLQNPVGTLQ